MKCGYAIGRGGHTPWRDPQIEATAMKSSLRKPTEPPRRLPPLLHFLGLHLVLGAAIGVAVVSVMVLLDVAGLKQLLIEADDPVLPLALLYGFNVLTFSSAAMGIAIMTLPADKG
jgi:hypothetical protein